MSERFRPSAAPETNDAFRILVVDDDPVAGQLLQELMKNLQHRYELHFASDGLVALEFLYRQGDYVAVPRPHLILLDINMPRLGGLETLSAIKADPELRLIPVIMLSTSASPDDIRQSYLSHANGYVRKPMDLERSEKLIRAVEAFWIEFALFPQMDERTKSLWNFPQNAYTGARIANEKLEAKSRTAQFEDSEPETEASADVPVCMERQTLMDDLGEAVQDLIGLHQHQFLAIQAGDDDCHRFDLLIHVANEKKQAMKYACLRHDEEHGCSKK